MSFDISQHLDHAAAELHKRAHGDGYTALHASVQGKYRDIVTDTFSGVLLGRTDYHGLEAIAAEIIRGWGTTSATPERITEQPAVSGDADNGGLVNAVKRVVRGKKTTDK